MRDVIDDEALVGLMGMDQLDVDGARQVESLSLMDDVEKKE